MDLDNLHRNLSLCLAMIWLHGIFAQSPYKVTHLEGTKIINGISVTVTHKGKISILHDLSYCDGETGPYYFGVEENMYTSGFGSYTFQFSPPVKEITVNFTGLSAEEGLMEEMRVYINGAHYAIPSPGTKINCEEMAVLTPKGNIRPCRGCAVSGWKGTKITGSISSFTVIDTVLAGDPAGVLIALFMGDSVDNDFVKVNRIKFADIAAGKSLIIHVPDIVNQYYILLDELGNNLNLDYFILNKENIIIYSEHFKPGNYILEIKNDEYTQKQQIIIE